jgi:DhnA family fructose-bisphosphate aldolase class Ia
MNQRSEDPKLTRLLTPWGGVTVAFDHGLSGVPVGLEDPRTRVREVLSAHPDGIITAIGLARAMQQEIEAAGVALVGALDASIMDGAQVAGRARVGTADQFAAVGADCVKILFQLAWKRDRLAEEVRTVSAAVREAEAAGLPIMIEPVLFGLEQPDDDDAAEQLVMDGCRIASEVGASILKVPMIRSEKLAHIVETSYCPVVVLGGSGIDARAFLQSIDGAMEAGVRGVTVGRNCWQAGNPEAMVEAMRAVVTDRDLGRAVARLAEERATAAVS